MFCSHSFTGVYVCVEVDGYEFYDKQAQTHSSIHSLNPHWDQVGSFSVLIWYLGLDEFQNDVKGR